MSRLGLLMTYVASVAIFPDFTQAHFHMSSSLGTKRHSQGLFKWLLKNALRIIIERDLETESVITGVSGSVAAFAPGGEQPGSAWPCSPQRALDRVCSVSPPAPPTARPLTTWLVLTLCDDFLSTLDYSSLFH